MAYTRRDVLCILTATVVCVIMTGWSSSSGTNLCGQNEFWDTIEQTCSPCTQAVCKVYETDLPKACHCVCKPDSRECRMIPEFDPSGLATEKNTSSNKTWLIGLTVVVVCHALGHLIFVVWYMCTQRRCNNAGIQEEQGFDQRCRRICQEVINNQPGQNADAENEDPNAVNREEEHDDLLRQPDVELVPM